MMQFMALAVSLNVALAGVAVGSESHGRAADGGNWNQRTVDGGETGGGPRRAEGSTSGGPKRFDVAGTIIGNGGRCFV